ATTTLLAEQWPASAMTVTLDAQLIVGGVRSTTVNVVVQVPVLPAASTTQRVTLVVPTPTVVPAVGRWVMSSAPLAVQLSDATTPVNTFGICCWQLPSAEFVVADGQVTDGGVRSTTLKLVVQVLLLPAASLTVTVIA